MKETVTKSVFLSRLKMLFWDWGATITSPDEQHSLAALETSGCWERGSLGEKSKAELEASCPPEAQGKAAARMSLAQAPLRGCAVRFEMTFQIFPSLHCLPILIKYVFLPFLLGCGFFETSASVRLELNWPVSSK